MKVKFILIFLLLASCNKEPKIKEAIVKQKETTQLEGTWELISSKKIQNDSIHSDDLSNKKMIKIINKSHFAFLNHNTNNETDTTNFFVSGGGKYTLVNNEYTEFLEYCNFREWENNTFKFTIEIKGDTLIQSGIEKIETLNVDRKIIETYLRIKN